MPLVIAEIIATGDEIRTGALVDSNSAYIARRLEEWGLTVSRHHAAGDDLTVLKRLFLEVAERSDVALVTGGLGPTADDLSAEAAAKAAGVELKLDEAALKSVEDWFLKRGRPMSPSNRKQAMLPSSCQRLENAFGTAPGFSLQIGKCRFFFLPGVPSEMRQMLSDQVQPKIFEALGARRDYHPIATLATFGLPESAVGERLAGLAESFPDIKVGLRARFPEIHVRLYGQGEDPERLQSNMKEAVQWVKNRLGAIRVISTAGERMEAVVGRLLHERGATLALAESCTGGLIASRITDVPGSSEYFLLSAVTYANQAKMDLLGVSAEMLHKWGAVHEETARAMAEGARRISGAAYGLSVTGIAGPGGGSKEKPVGLVCIGLSSPGRARGYRYQFAFGNRRMNKRIFAATALDLLRRELMGAEPQPPKYSADQQEDE